MSPKKKKRKPYTLTQETRDRMSKAHTGKKLSAATKKKISDARKLREQLIEMGLLKPYRHTAETRKHLSKLALERAKTRKGKLSLKSAQTARKQRATAVRSDKNTEEVVRQIAADW